MPLQAPAKPTSRAAKQRPTSSGLLKVWIAQRQLLRVLEAQRQSAPLHESAFAVEVVTDGYYLLRKNLFDLVALDRNLPNAAKSLSLADGEGSGSRPPHEPGLHTMLAYDIAALNALAADYATLHAEVLLSGARDVAHVVQQHGRQLKNFLANLFPRARGRLKADRVFSLPRKVRRPDPKGNVPKSAQGFSGSNPNLMS